MDDKTHSTPPHRRSQERHIKDKPSPRQSPMLPPPRPLPRPQKKSKSSTPSPSHPQNTSRPSIPRSPRPHNVSKPSTSPSLARRPQAPIAPASTLRPAPARPAPASTLQPVPAQPAPASTLQPAPARPAPNLQWSTVRSPRRWNMWPEIKIRVSRLPPNMTTEDIYKLFYGYGVINYVKIENRAIGNALITFSPPPYNAFWEHGPIAITREHGEVVAVRLQVLDHPPFRHVSPVDPQRTYPERMIIYVARLGFGSMRTPSIATIMRTLQPLRTHQISIMLKVHPFRELDIVFPIPHSGGQKHTTYRMVIELSQMQKLYIIVDSSDCAKLMFTLKCPPRYFNQHKDTEMDPDYRFNATEWQPYSRQVDIDKDMNNRWKEPVSLHRSDPYIDPGRWLTYVVQLAPGQHRQHVFQNMQEALQDYNIQVIQGHSINVEGPADLTHWNSLNKPVNSDQIGLSSLEELMHSTIPRLDFDVRFQLEACISQNLIQECNISIDFLRTLDTRSNAKLLLENVVASGRTFTNPMNIFTAHALGNHRKITVPDGCVLMHSVTITPTTVVVNTPTVDMENRIIRQYRSDSGRFLRVRFTDEVFFGKLQPRRNENFTDVLLRIKRAMRRGIIVGGRHYEFLAFGNSQFRENGAYFFAPTAHLSLTNIRFNMGSFNHIQIIAKYAARIGQCFSTTKAIKSVGSNYSVSKISDIERNGYNFTDGVGKISPFLAQMIGNDYGHGSDYPSVFQFRMGGRKGVLTVDPTLKGNAIHIRPSQEKFSTEQDKLEIIRRSLFSTACLNQQLILVLSTLGIPDRTFMQKMQLCLAEVDQAMTDENLALQLLPKNVDFNQITLILAKMILDGFMYDPFANSLLLLWRAWIIKFLKDKAKMPVQESAFVLGCVDETATLRADAGQLPQIFLQIPDPPLNKQGLYKTITGTCILARNPSLHPGDIRVVQAVECPVLRHIKNAVVFPQRGDRPVANMCSGGDLDGDDYVVIWDQDFVPDERDHAPMDYTAAPPLKSKGDVTTEDIIQFFCEYIKNDSLRLIAVAHRAQADFSPIGASDSRCVQLAHLHSQAVDYPKTGIPAIMGDDLRPRKWPHWMGRAKNKSYHSKRVLGQLYDQVSLVNFEPQYRRAFDERVLTAYDDLEPDMLETAGEIKREYDMAIRRVMAQHSIETEFEVWSAFVMRHNKEASEYSFAEELGRLMQHLKSEYREKCVKRAGTTMLERDMNKIRRFVAAVYTVTAQQTSEHIEHQDRYRDIAELGGEESASTATHAPFISFPWIFADELGEIAQHGKSASSDTRDSISRMQTIRNSRILPKAFRVQAFGVKASGIQADLCELGELPEARLRAEFQRTSYDNTASYHPTPKKTDRYNEFTERLFASTQIPDHLVPSFNINLNFDRLPTNAGEEVSHGGHGGNMIDSHHEHLQPLLPSLSSASRSHSHSQSHSSSSSSPSVELTQHIITTRQQKADTSIQANLSVAGSGQANDTKDDQSDASGEEVIELAQKTTAFDSLTALLG